MKVVINTCYGGFAISRWGVEFMASRGNERARRELCKYQEGGRWFGFGDVNGMRGGYERDDPDLVAAIEALGKRASGHGAKLIVVDIPDDVEWTIEGYHGVEHVAETHRTWP